MNCQECGSRTTAHESRHTVDHAGSHGYLCVRCSKSGRFVRVNDPDGGGLHASQVWMPKERRAG